MAKHVAMVRTIGMGRRGNGTWRGLLLAAVVLPLGLSLPVSGADFSTWTHKRRVSFPGYDRSETLTNFPLLVSFGTNVANFSYSEFTSDRGADLRFVSPDEAAELNYEIEKWDTNGLSHVWVQVQALASNGHIWAYWGKSSATQPAYTTNGATWSDGFAAVWHLGEDAIDGATTADLHRDSTTEGHHGDQHGNSTVAGPIGIGQYFDGASDMVEVEHDPRFNGSAPGLTVEAWARGQADTPLWGGIADKGIAGGWRLGRYGAASAYIFLHNGVYFDAGDTVADGRWHHIAGVVDGGTMRLYVDGEEVGSGTTPGLPTGVDPVRIGKTNNNEPWKGGVDEVRISDTPRTPAWVWACWLSQASNSSFVAIEPGRGAVIGDAMVFEGDSGTTTASLLVTLPGPVGEEVAIDFISSNGAALAGEDYIATNGTLTIPSGQTNGSITVRVIGDTTYEGDSESFFIVLTNVSHGILEGPVGECTILDDDAKPSVWVNTVIQGEGDAGSDTNVGFQVSMSAVSGVDVYVDYLTSDGTAEGGFDYTAAGGTLTIPAGEGSGEIPVTILGDDKYEGSSENFYVTLSDASNATISGSQATGTIIDDDSQPLMSIRDAAVTEGNSGSAWIGLTVRLSAVSGLDAWATYATSNGTAIAGPTDDYDYLAATDSLLIPAGDEETTVWVQIWGDILDEGLSETFYVVLSGVVNAILTDGLGAGRIDDNDSAAFSVSDAQVHEGDVSGSTNLDFTVSLGAKRAVDVAVDFQTTNGIAQAPSDYTHTSGTIVIPAGAVYTTVSVTVNGDLSDEPLFETFYLDLSNPSNTTILDGRGIGKIIDDEGPTPAVTIEDASVEEGDSTYPNMLLRITLDTPHYVDVSVDYVTSNQTAQAGSDYSGLQSLLTIPVGDTNGTIAVLVYPDTADEGVSETFTVSLSNPQNATLAVTQATGTIIDDDPPPTLSIDDPLAAERDPGETSDAVFRVSLSAASGFDVTVDFATAGGTAMEGIDYVGTNGTVRIPAGIDSATVPVTVNGDQLDEADVERFTMHLSNPTNATIGVSQGQATIIDDELTPWMWANDVTVVEGDSGTTSLVFTIGMSHAQVTNVTVNYYTTDDSAEAGTDYIATNGALTIPIGQMSATVPVTIIGDGSDEGAWQTFHMNLSNAVFAVLSDPQGEGRIQDDDEPVASVGNATVLEGHSGTVNAVFPVTLGGEGVLDVEIDFVTSNGTAIAGTDFVQTNGTLVIPGGQTNANLIVLVTGDALDEGASEIFYVNFVSITNAALPVNRRTGTITDDDDPPSAAVGDASVTEGDAGTTNLDFRVTLDAPSGLDVSVNYSTSNGTALAGTDYVAVVDLLVIPAGDTNGQISVSVQGDELHEGVAEDLHVNLGNVANATVARGSATGTITDDDDPPTLNLSGGSTLEGDAGQKPADFLLVLDAPSGLDVTATFVTSNGTASSGSDYVATNGTVTIPAGDTNGAATVLLNGDEIDEEDTEVFYLNVTNVQNAVIGVGTAGYTINDDDSPPSLTILDAIVTEGDAGTTNANFAVAVSIASELEIQVDFATSNGVAQAGIDYTSTTGRLVISAGTATGTISVAVTGDDIFEGLSEDFTMHLSNATNALIIGASAVGTITENDLPPSLSMLPVTVTEGDTGTTNVNFPIILDAAAEVDATVDFVTSNGTALTGSDYVGTNGTLLIPAGETNGFITVAVIGDESYEGASENFQLVLTNSSNATIVVTNAQANITDDDARPKFYVDDTEVREGAAGSTQMQFVVRLNSRSILPAEVDYETSNGTAMAAGDYIQTNGTVTIPAGGITAIVSVVVIGDPVFEGAAERLYLVLSDPVDATVADGEGEGRIVDDDPAPTLVIADATVAETDVGTTSAVFVATLSAAAETDARVDFVTSNGTAGAGVDYLATNGTLVIPAGETNGAISVLVLADDVYEGPSENFYLGLTNATNVAFTAGLREGTILEDESMPDVWITDEGVVEGNAATTGMVFEVRLSFTAAVDVVVDYRSSNGTAEAGSDYTAVAGTLTIPAGVITGQIGVTVFGDTLDETDADTFYVALSNALHADIIGALGMGSIFDDDGTPLLTIDDPVTLEGDVGTHFAQFTVSLSAPSDLDVNADYATSNGTATAGSDYAGQGGSLVILAGDTARTIAITVSGDTNDEGRAESFFVQLSDVTNAIAAKTLGECRIEDDDAPALAIQPGGVLEGDSGRTNVIFNVALNYGGVLDVTVAFATSNGTAESGFDFVPTNGVLTIPAGETNATVEVAANGDTLYEGVAEEFSLELSSVSNATVAAGKAVGMITDDDALPLMRIGDITVIEGDVGSTSAVFTVSLLTVAGIDATVVYATSNGTAEAGTDFFPAGGILTIPSGDPSGKITVDVRGDFADEGVLERFYVRLTDPFHAVLSDDTGEGLIVDDDATPLVSIGDALVEEGDSGPTSIVFDVTLSSAAGVDVTVEFATSNGTAEAGLDYTASNGTVLLPAGQAQGALSITVHGDAADEGEFETFLVMLRSASNATIASAEGQGTIIDDDATRLLTIDDTSVSEPEVGTTAAVFTVSLDGVAEDDVTVVYTTSNGSAEAGFDYVATSGALAIPAGEVLGKVEVTVMSDVLGEGVSETFFLHLSSPTGAILGDAVAECAIVDEVPYVRIEDVSIIEGDSGITSAVLRVNLSYASDLGVSVDFSTSNGTAEAGADYVPVGGTLFVPSGQSNGSITVQVSGDTLHEGVSELFYVRLSNPSNATMERAAGACTIIDDESPPLLWVGDVTVVERDAEETNAVFAVSLDAPAGIEISLVYSTSNGTAVAGLDFVGTNGIIVMPRGTVATTIVVTIKGDDVDEGDAEVFYMTLGGVSNATVQDGLGKGTIIDDDPVPLLSIGDVFITEGDAGTTDAVFTASISALSALDVTAEYTTSNGTALSGPDYVLSAGLLTITSGALRTTVVVPVRGDLFEEDEEVFYVDLSNPENATIAESRGQGNIVDDDEADPQVWVGDASVIEGDVFPTSVTFRISLSGTGPLDTFVMFVTSNGSATAGSDYVPSNGTLRITAGQTEGTVKIAVLPDADDEGIHETFYLLLTNAANGRVTGGVGEGRIIDDDTPLISIADVSVVEGDTGTTNVGFSIALSFAADDDVTIEFTTSNGTAVADGDYLGTNGTLVVPAGQTNASLTVLVKGDTLYEGVSETFTMRLLTASNAAVVAGVGLCTVVDDDRTPLLWIHDDAVYEGDSGTTVAVFAVSLSEEVGIDVKVDYMSADGTAESGRDYGAIAGTLTIPVGMTATALTVVVKGDLLDEGSFEKFKVVLSNAVNALVSGSEGEATIIDDDDPPLLSIDDTLVTEGDVGSTTAVFAVRLTMPTDSDVTLAFTTSDDSASSGSDYVGTNGVLTIPRDETNGEIVVIVRGDTFDEGISERFFVNLSNVSNAIGVSATGSGTIIDDEDPPLLWIGDVTVKEGDSGTTNAAFEVRLSEVSGLAVAAVFTTSNGTAVSGADYIGTNGTLAIPPGATTGSIVVAVFGDAATEGVAENFFVALTNVANALILDGIGEGTILDDAPFLRIADATVLEGDVGTTDAVFVVTLDSSSLVDVAVDYATADGSARAGLDYAARSGRLVIPSGDTNASIAVPVTGDRLYETASERFQLALGSASNATIISGQAAGMIVDDDQIPFLWVTDATVAEGDAGTTNARARVTLSAVAGVDVSMVFATFDDTAIAGEDYTATGGVLVIGQGQTNAGVAIRVYADVVDEGDSERFFLRISGASNATISANQGDVTIVDDDGSPLLGIQDVMMTEGDSGTNYLDLVVVLNLASGRDVTADFASSNGTAVAGTDYIATNGVVTIPAGQTTGTISVAVVGDVSDEGAFETFFVDLDNVSGAGLAGARGQGTIIDDDEDNRILWILGADVLEGDGGTTNLEFTVGMSGPSPIDVSVDFATSNGTAMAGADYVAKTGRLSIPPGQVEGTISVGVKGDTLYEGSWETFTVNLSDPSNAVIADSEGVGRVFDDDEATSALHIDDVVENEGDSGVTGVIFTVSLGLPAATNVTAAFTTSNGTAEAGTDYVATNGTIEIPAGQTNAYIVVLVMGDTNIEASVETFFVVLGFPTNAPLGDPVGQGNIVDDESGDKDADGLLDSWEDLYFGATNHPDGDPSDDPDRDGHDNSQEQTAGTVPTNRLSVLMAAAPFVAGGLVVVEWPSVMGRLYTVQTTTNLLLPGSWELVPETGYLDIPGTGGTMAYTNGPPDSARVYRVRASFP